MKNEFTISVVSTFGVRRHGVGILLDTEEVYQKMRTYGLKVDG